MATLSELLARWRELEAPLDKGDAVQFSLVLGEDQDEAEVRRVLQEALGTTPALEPAFKGHLRTETGDRFWILTLPNLPALGSEALQFETAAALREALGLRSARPVLVDSLIGEAMVLREEAVFDFCNSDDPCPEERGWALVGIGALSAWDKTRGAGAKIASIDTGYSSHVQLQGVLTPEPHLNLVEGGTDARDRFSRDVFLPNPGHGTLVASVVASRGQVHPGGHTDGPKEVTGSAPEAKILPIRAIRSVVDMRQSNIPAAIEHAIEQKCDVIIMALGSAVPIEPVEVALRAATRAGLVVVCAAGNCVGFVVFPARFAPEGLATAVAAVDHAYRPWEKTSKGPAVTVSCFGEGVWGARKNAADAPDDVVAPSQGTTLASSLTAGVAALWVQANGGREALKTRAKAAGVTVQKLFNDALIATAHRPSGWPRGMGAGLVNAAALVARPLPAAEEALPDVPLPLTHVTPLRRYLVTTAEEVDQLAGLEAAGLSEDLAGEALWNLYRTSAARRARASGAGREGLEALDADPPKTPGLERELGPRRRLSALID